jgi:thiamine pyrophosphate-dependent acetolactate synthase large subunit-like protein
VVSRSFRADSGAIATVAQALNASQRPVFIIGERVWIATADGRLVRLAERHGAVVGRAP